MNFIFLFNLIRLFGQGRVNALKVQMARPLSMVITPLLCHYWIFKLLNTMMTQTATTYPIQLRPLHALNWAPHALNWVPQLRHLGPWMGPYAHPRHNGFDGRVISRHARCTWRWRLLRAELVSKRFQFLQVK